MRKIKNRCEIKIILLIVLIIISCNNRSSRNIIDLDDVKLEQIKISDTFVISELFRPVNMQIVGNYIVMNTLAQDGVNRAFYLYNKTNLDYLGEYIYFGRGSGEIMDLNPNYFYITSDSTFIANTSYINETEFLVSNDSIKLINSVPISDAVHSNIYRIDNNKHIVNEMMRESEFEFSLQKRDSMSKFTTTQFGQFPDLHSQKLQGEGIENLYHKLNITTENSFISFYLRVPIIKKFDHDLNLISEYIMSDNIDYKVYNFDEVMDSNKYFFSCVKNYGNMIFVIYNDEYLLMNENCEILRRISISDGVLSNIFSFDDCFMYILDTNIDPYKLYKVKL